MATADDDPPRGKKGSDMRRDGVDEEHPSTRQAPMHSNAAMKLMLYCRLTMM